MDALYVVISDTNEVDSLLFSDEKPVIGLCYAMNGKDLFETTNLQVAKNYAKHLTEVLGPKYPKIKYTICKCIPIEIIGEA